MRFWAFFLTSHKCSYLTCLVSSDHQKNQNFIQWDQFFWIHKQWLLQICYVWLKVQIPRDLLSACKICLLAHLKLNLFCSFCQLIWSIRSNLLLIWGWNWSANWCHILGKKCSQQHDGIKTHLNVLWVSASTMSLLYKSLVAVLSWYCVSLPYYQYEFSDMKICLIQIEPVCCWSCVIVGEWRPV